MATIKINDLPASRALDRDAMSRIRGGDGAPWVYGWIQAYTGESANDFRAINFYQVNNYQTNNYFADQMINQFQTVNVVNSAANSNLNVKVDEGSTNNKPVI